jgi:hypothetical protein
MRSSRNDKRRPVRQRHADRSQVPADPAMARALARLLTILAGNDDREQHTDRKPRTH